jgi:alpha-amylase
VLSFCFGVHNHQPVGNFDHVVAEATERAYRPFLERLRARPEVRLTAHYTGSLLEWLAERAPRTFDLLGEVVARGQVELLTGGFWEPILAVLPDHDKLSQIARLTGLIESRFGVRPRGLWLAERVWEPHLPRPLREAGVEYVLVDDSHFALAGLDPESLGGYYLTEEQGAVVAVFPISQRLRYLIPFADVEASLEYLAGRRDVTAVTVVDDGEKFGVWPGTHAHVYEQGWLDRFFDRLLGTPWLRLATLGEVLDAVPAAGPVYLPAASYREMGEWALPASAGRRLLAARRRLASIPEGGDIADLLRGGFWRSFLVRYPEVGDAYWRMLRVSGAIQRALGDRPGDPRLAEARSALHRAQANDAYWHGVFGGCYLPHLRRGIRQALLAAERLLAEATEAPPAAWVRADVNGDGREEIVVRTRELAVTVSPAQGGALTEIGSLVRGLDLADVLARRPEAYHEELRERARAAAEAGRAQTIHEPAAAKEPGLEALLQYDPFRRGSLLDGLFDGDGALDPVAPWGAARLALPGVALAAGVEERDGGVEACLRLEGQSGPLAGVRKTITVRGARVAARYRLEPAPAARGGRWAVQWNLALTAGEGPGRYLALPDRPPPRSRGRRLGLTELALVDEWIGLEAVLHWSPAAEVAWGPVETVSISEGGYERIYQGTAFLIVWPLDTVSSDPWELETALTVRPR